MTEPRPSPTARALDRPFAPVPIAPLAGVRAVFGLTLLYECVRYLLGGWPRAMYEEPPVLFKYWGLEWASPDALPWSATAHFYLLAGLSACVAAGFLYRLAAPLLWAGFTLVFLWDQAHYLNHFYFTSLVAGLLAVTPAHRAFSVDAWLRPTLRSATCPWWAVNVLRFQTGVVYFYGGVAKLNADWLTGKPTELMLSARTDFPLVGPLLDEPLAWRAVAWGGAAFDLLIVPALYWRRTRLAALVAAAGFHLTNHLLFNIGIFPWLALFVTVLLWPPGGSRHLTPLGLLRLAGGMFYLARGLAALQSPGGVTALPTAWAGLQLAGLAAAGLLFWPRGRAAGFVLCGFIQAAAAAYYAANSGVPWWALLWLVPIAAAFGALVWPPWWLRDWRFGAELCEPEARARESTPEKPFAGRTPRSRFGLTKSLSAALLLIFCLWQLLMPLRHHLYPGDVAWTEEGHKWSWRMKLRVRRSAGTVFYVDDANGVPVTVVFPRDHLPKRFLTDRQAREVQADPDLILQFARFLANEYEARGAAAPVRVYARCEVSLNGGPYRLLIDPAADLAAADWPLGPKPWVLKYDAD